MGWSSLAIGDCCYACDGCRWVYGVEVDLRMAIIYKHEIAKLTLRWLSFGHVRRSQVGHWVADLVVR